VDKKLSDNKRAVIEWLATPKWQREPSTQRALADKLGIHEITVSRWKKRFTERINKAAREKMAEHLPHVLASVIGQAESGSYQHQKLYLEMVGEYLPHQKITNEGETRIVVRWDKDADNPD